MIESLKPLSRVEFSLMPVAVNVFIVCEEFEDVIDTFMPFVLFSMVVVRAELAAACLSNSGDENEEVSLRFESGESEDIFCFVL